MSSAGPFSGGVCHPGWSCWSLFFRRSLSYTVSTIHLAVGYLAHGAGACAVIKQTAEFGQDGREPLFLALWMLTCISFWGGLAPVVLRAIRVHGGNSNGD